MRRDIELRANQATAGTPEVDDGASRKAVWIGLPAELVPDRSREAVEHFIEHARRDCACFEVSSLSATEVPLIRNRWAMPGKPRRRPNRVLPTCGVYVLWSVPTQEFYIGCSDWLEPRWKNHVWKIANGKHDQPRIRELCELHGIEGFRFAVIQTCETGQQFHLEGFWIRALSPSINPLYHSVARGKHPSEFST